MRSLSTINGSRWFRHLIVAFAPAALLAGCATYHALPIDPTEHAREFSERSLNGAGVAAFARQNDAKEWPPKEWDLDALTLAAFYYHPDLDTARARYAIARAGIVTEYFSYPLGQVRVPAGGKVHAAHGGGRPVVAQPERAV